jgi:Cd2+/Zn2+-exporting ATPase
VVFDKTGTLTHGSFKVTEIVPENGLTELELLTLAAQAEIHSSHPLAESIKQAYHALSGTHRQAEVEVLESYEEMAGFGIKAKLNGNTILVGNDAILHRENVPHTTCDVPGTVVHVALDGRYQGFLIVADQIKTDVSEAVEQLHAVGVEHIAMLSGDQEDVAGRVAESAGLDSFKAGLLPAEKVEELEKILAQSHEGAVAYVGDGINDAPALARADVGIAMGAFGTDAARETADVVLMTDTISRVADAIQLGKRTRRIVWQNIGMALGIKLVFILLGVAGAATMWEAVFADVGVTVLAVLNASRAMR